MTIRKVSRGYYFRKHQSKLHTQPSMQFRTTDSNVVRSIWERLQSLATITWFQELPLS